MSAIARLSRLILSHSDEVALLDASGVASFAGAIPIIAAATDLSSPATSTLSRSLAFLWFYRLCRRCLTAILALLGTIVRAIQMARKTLEIE